MIPRTQTREIEVKKMTYTEAKKLATKKNPNVVYEGDAGNGWTFQVYYCSIRNKVVSLSISPEGISIV
jgi:hypothetical protein